MASLMDNLMDLLEKENDEYRKLLDLSMKKTSVIIEGNIAELDKITEDEQERVGVITKLEAKREAIMKDIAAVLNKDVQSLKLNQLTALLDGRTKEQNRLSNIHTTLKLTIDQLVKVNNHNRDLITDSLEMVEFNMNILKGMRAAPETANYTKGAYSSGVQMGTDVKQFDAKQ